MIQPGHNFTHVTIASLSRHVQNCDLVKLLFFFSEEHLFLQGFSPELINHLWNSPPVVYWEYGHIVAHECMDIFMGIDIWRYVSAVHIH